jgi:5-methylcytosine-specific restriction endonuclease McrA
VGGVRKFAKFCIPCAKEQWLAWKRDTDKRHYIKNKVSEEWATQRREKLIKNSLKRKFGIDEQTYKKMLAEQGGVCACCGNPEIRIDPRTGNPLSLAVDHDHQTGKIRALLCSACNISFGLLNESPERIRYLLQYAERIQQNQ